jgi:hypothetical protein
MKHFTLLSLLLGSILILSSCKGDTGPPGPPGISILGTTYDVRVDFLPQEDYEAVFNFTPPIERSDVVLCYIQWEIVSGRPVWRLLPQTVLFTEGTLQYQYDFTDIDFRLFLESNFSLSALGPEWTRNQTFRVVVVPSDFGGRMDYTNYEQVAERLGIQEEDIVRLDLRKDSKK